MRCLVFDCETTTLNSGDPFHPDNVLCLVGVRWVGGDSIIHDVEYTPTPYGSVLQEIQSAVNTADILVASNFKFDYNWLCRYGISVPTSTEIWDLQIGEYIQTGQEAKYASLDGMSEKYGLPIKPNEVRALWESGIDTRDIPLTTLGSYLEHDLETTEKLFIIQYNQHKELRPLILCSSYDERTTAEMEQSGLLWDFIRAKEKAFEIDQSIELIDGNLRDFADGFPINWGSAAHISAVLFGGDIKYVEKQPYVFTYKDGKQAVKYKNAVLLKHYDGLIDPKQYRAKPTAKEGIWSTDEGTLGWILQKKPKKQPRRLIELLLERRGLMKLRSTYYEGFSLNIGENQYIDRLHPTYHHAATDTSRLSSSGPNAQNIPAEVRECIVSRFKY